MTFKLESEWTVDVFLAPDICDKLYWAEAQHFTRNHMSHQAMTTITVAPLSIPPPHPSNTTILSQTRAGNSG